MILKAFSVYDSKVKAFGPVFFQNAAGAAVRDFSDACNSEKTVFYKHPSDYVLYEIGLWDDSTGELSSISPHINLGIGSSFVERKPVYRPAALDDIPNHLAGDVIKALDNPLSTVEELSNGK